MVRKNEGGCSVRARVDRTETISRKREQSRRGQQAELMVRLQWVSLALVSLWVLSPALQSGEDSSGRWREHHWGERQRHSEKGMDGTHPKKVLKRWKRYFQEGQGE